MYTLKFDDKAIEFLERCEKHISKRIWNKLQEAKSNPHRYFEKLVNRSDYKLRIGDYRVVADINDSELIIEVNLIGHRKNVYDK
jgi:mRNA interferase RelE/StbE